MGCTLMGGPQALEAFPTRNHRVTFRDTRRDGVRSILGPGEVTHMKICIPTAGQGGLDDRVGEHFGRVPTYTIYDTDSGECDVLPNASEHMGGTGLPAEHLREAGVDVVLCAGLGRRAIALLSEGGIEVWTGASGTAGEVVRAWQEGQLAGAEPCTQRTFHDRHA